MGIFQSLSGLVMDSNKSITFINIEKRKVRVRNEEKEKTFH